MGFNEKVAQIKPDDFGFIVKNGKRSSVLNNFDFESLCYNSYKFVKQDAPEIINSGDFRKLIKECFCDRKIFIFDVDIDYLDFNDCLYFVLWINDQIKYWNEMEREHLSREPEMDLIAAGINEMDIFGDLNVTDSIAIKYGLTPWEVEGWSYQRVFDIQLKSKKEAEFQKKLIEIQKRKSKNKNGHS